MIFELCVQTASMLIKSYMLPVSHQIDIRAAIFGENFMRSENYICTLLFENKAYSYLTKISVRGNTMSLQF